MSPRLRSFNSPGIMVAYHFLDVQVLHSLLTTHGGLATSQVLDPCREMYTNHLDPAVTKRKFSLAEIGLTILLYAKVCSNAFLLELCVWVS